MSDGLQFPVAGQVSPELLNGLSELGGLLRRAREETRGQKEATEQAKQGWDLLLERFNALTTAARTVIGQIAPLVTAVADLSDEQDHLDEMSTRLALDFNEGADAAGRFADETEAMSAAAHMFQAGARLTQEQLNALELVAGSASRTLGITTKAATDALTESLISGTERGLRQFGPELSAVAGDAHTLQERLDTLVEVAGHTRQATDNASDAMARFKDSIEDGERAIASGFVSELRALDEESNRTFGPASTQVEDLDEKLHALGATGAFVFHELYTAADLYLNGLAAIVITVGHLVWLFLRIPADPLHAGDMIRNARAAISEAWGAVRQSGRELAVGTGERSSAEAPAEPDAPQHRFSRGASDETTLDASFARSVNDRQDAGQRRSGGGATDEADARKAKYDAAREALEGERRVWRAFMEERDRRAETERAQLDALTEREGRRQTAERDRAKEQERDSASKTRGQDPEVVRAQSAAEHEQRINRSRLLAMRSFTEVWRDMHEEQVSAAQIAAEGLQNAFGQAGRVLSDHLKALAAGRETMEQFGRGMLSDLFSRLGDESFAKAGFYFAEGLGKLVAYDYPGAGVAFAASAAYMAAGATFSAGGAAVAPKGTGAQMAANDNGRGAPSRGRASNVSPRGDGAAGGGSTLVIQFGGPVIGGSPAQIGREVGRFINAAATQTGFQLAPGAVGRRVA